MKGQILLWLRGNVRIRIKGSFCERFLNLCAFHGLKLWKITPVEQGYEASISLENFRKLKVLVKKSHVHLCILEKRGLPFFLYRNRKRKALFFSFFLAVFLTAWLSFFIWDIQVSGNLSVTDEKILDYLEQEGIRQGIWKSSLDYRQLAERLRQFFPEFTWVSVKLQGTRLLIDLKENMDPKIGGTDEAALQNPPGTVENGEGMQLLENGQADTAGSIASNRNGTVVRIITRSGTPLVKAGDEVQKGEILVSGQIDLVNDAAEVYDHRYVKADADVYIRYSYPYEDELSLKQQVKTYSGRELSRKLLKFGNFHLGLPFLSIPYEQYDCITSSHQLRIRENFYLPVYFSDITVKEYELSEKILGRQEAEGVILKNLENFLEKIQEKGVQIFQNDVKIETTDSICRARGKILLIEKSGVYVETAPVSDP